MHPWERYIQRVENRDLIVGKYIRLQVERHLSDLKKQSTEDFPYYFDEKIAEGICKFFPAALKHSIGEHAGQRFEIEDWQAFFLANLFGWQRDDGRGRRFRQAFFTVARKNGKAEHIDNWLPTPDGMKQMKHVEVGDYLIGEDGSPVQVQAVTEIQNDRPCVEIVFSDGEKITCDENHEWVFRKKRKKGSRGEKPSIYFTDEVVESKDLLGKELFDSQGAKYRVKNVVFQGTHQCLPVDPYVLGAWLGDGHSAGCRITGEQDDIQTIINAIEYAGYKWRRVSLGNKPDHVWTISVTNGRSKPTLSNDLKKAGVLRNKHIPSQYFVSDVKQRVALLQGLMDTDGTISESGQCEFTQMSGQLADDVKKLLNSLGVHCKPIKCDARIDGVSVGEKTRLLFFPPSWLMPFRLPRKRQRVRVKKKDGTRKVVSVTKLPQNQKTKCVQVDGGVYLTGNYVLTHNSTLAAGIAMYMAAIDFNPISKEPESRSQIILAATKREQAEKVIFAECLRMRHQSKLLKDSSTVANKIMTFNHNGGNIQCVGSDRPYDGLNPQMVSLDETHAFSNPHRKFYNTMVTGSGSRVQPLLMTTTTAGDDQSHIWLEQIRFCKSVLNDTVKEETLLPIIYELDEEDDPLDEDNWIKANPNLGVSITKDFLHAQAKPCKTSTTALNRFKRYHANVLVSSTERIFSLEDFDQCRGQLSDWKQADCVAAGIDLGGRDDLAAYALVARFRTGEYKSDDTPIYRYEAKTFSYIARNSKRDLTAIPFCDWIANGLIKVTESPITDLQHDFVNAYWDNFCIDAAIDPYQAQQFGEQVSQQGVVIATMAQTTAHFNEPISDFRQSMADGRFRHDGNPLLRWCLTNAVAVRDRQDRWMLDKANSSSKIDPLVAMLMAYRRAMVAPGRGDGNVFIT